MRDTTGLIHICWLKSHNPKHLVNLDLRYLNWGGVGEIVKFKGVQLEAIGSSFKVVILSSQFINNPFVLS